MDEYSILRSSITAAAADECMPTTRKNGLGVRILNGCVMLSLVLNPDILQRGNPPSRISFSHPPPHW